MPTVCARLTSALEITGSLARPTNGERDRVLDQPECQSESSDVTGHPDIGGDMGGDISDPVHLPPSRDPLTSMSQMSSTSRRPSSATEWKTIIKHRFGRCRRWPFNSGYTCLFDRKRSYKATGDLIRDQNAGSGVDGAPNLTSYTEGSRPPWRMRES